MHTIHKGAARKKGFLLALLLFLAGCGASGTANIPTSPYQVTTDKASDAVTSTEGDGQVVFDITSKTGIGRAEITRADGQWPDQVEIRLHVRGLESLTVTYGGVAVHTAVPSSGDKIYDQTVQLPDKPSPAKALDSRYEMPLIVVDADGQTDIPLDDGYFALRLPLDFHEGAFTTFSVDWIDFYR